MSNRWSCLPMAFAKVLDVPVDRIVKSCGHDGSAIWWPERNDPECRRGFHIQEMIDFAFTQGYSVTPFEAIPVAKGSETTTERVIPMLESSENRMTRALVNDGVLTGETLEGLGHAIAWIGGDIYDSANRITELSDFNIQTFWLVLKIKSS